MPRFRLTVAYDGTGLVGWQRQASGVSVQGLLEDALAQLDGQAVTVIGAGRTDAGVHAIEQVAGASLRREIDAATLVRAVNVRLPPAVRVTGASVAPSSFHPRFDARAKTYHYRIWNREVLDPFERSYVWHVPAPRLDGAAMEAGAALLQGRHDFAAFQATGSAAGTTDRELFWSVVKTGSGMFCGSSGPEDLPGPVLTYQVCGNGFLRHMVRNIVGALVEVGRGRRPPAWIGDVLESRDRAAGGQTAPPEGLFLVRVEYDAYNRSLPPRNPHVA
jgi:tRNA pseudouridine38-40 synthase